MRIRPATFVAAPLALAVAFTSTALAQEQEQEEQKDHHEAHAEAQHTQEKARKGMTVTLAAVNESGIEGKAKIAHAEGTDEPGAHQVKIRVNGTEEGQTYPAHVHQGTCEEGGPVVTALNPVEAGPEMASSTTVLSPADLAMGPAAEGPVTAEADERAEDEAAYVEARGDVDELLAEGREHPNLFIQVHAPDGPPVACGDIEHGAKADRGMKKDEDRQKD